LFIGNKFGESYYPLGANEFEIAGFRKLKAIYKAFVAALLRSYHFSIKLKVQ
jgi:hypothetical protein